MAEKLRVAIAIGTLIACTACGSSGNASAPPTTSPTGGATTFLPKTGASLITQLPRPLPDANAPLCRPAQIKYYGLGRVPEMTGEHSFDVLVGNSSKTSCNLRGYPAVTFYQETAAVGFDYGYGSGPYLDHNPPAFVTIRPNGRPGAYFKVAKYRCDAGDAGWPSTARVWLQGSRVPWIIDLTTFHVLDICTHQSGNAAGMLVNTSKWGYVTGGGIAVIPTKMTAG